MNELKVCIQYTKLTSVNTSITLPYHFFIATLFVSLSLSLALYGRREI
jgi:hypothetical protein